jgi:hypothetical protein
LGQRDLKSVFSKQKKPRSFGVGLLYWFTMLF